MERPQVSERIPGAFLWQVLYGNRTGAQISLGAAGAEVATITFSPRRTKPWQRARVSR